MLVVLDECVSDAVGKRLLAEGTFELVRAADVSPRATDPTVLKLATRVGALLITNDKDFGDLVVGLGSVSSGVLLCRLGSLDLVEEADKVVEALSSYGESLLGAFSVLSPRGLRVRRLESQSPRRQQQRRRP